MAPSRIAILGPGGVGGLLGGVLARAGHDVVCVASPSTARILAGRGLVVRSAIFGDFTVPVAAVTTLSEPVDACLVTVKATTLVQALQRLPADELGSAVVVPFLNGLDHVSLLRGHYPAATVAAATISVESTRVASGVIEHTSPFANIEIAGATRVAVTLRDAGLSVVERDDERTVLWRKLSLLAPLALLTTSAGAPIGRVREQHDRLLHDVVREVVAVARADGADVDEDHPLQFLRSAPAAMKSSMQRDAEAGRPIELDAIGGAVVRAARRLDVAVPATETLVSQIAAA